MSLNSWTKEIRHKGLNKYRLVTGPEWDVVEEKAAAQVAVWNEMWQRRVEKEERARDRKSSIEVALALTKEAKESIEGIERTLVRSLEKRHLIDFETLRDRSTFSRPRPLGIPSITLPEPPKETDPVYQAELIYIEHSLFSKGIEGLKFIERQTGRRLSITVPDSWLDGSQSDQSKSRDRAIAIVQKPQETDWLYQPRLGLMDKMLPSRRQKKVAAAKLLYKNDCEKWAKQCDEGKLRYERDYRNWMKESQRLSEQNYECEQDYRKRVLQWESDEIEFKRKQNEGNESIDRKRERYFGKQADAIVDYCELVLSNSEYPDSYPQAFELDYNPETKILIVNYSLPSVENIPKLKEVKYVQSRNDLVELYLPDSVVNKLYDSLVYQVTLRSIHELFDADQIEALDAIVFNGWVRSIDRATGQEVNACILTIQVNRQEFQAVNFANVDAKTCFKNLKGVGSSKLHSLTPVAPLMDISREDARFVASYPVVDGLDESNNLAAMDWEDFEHLIRELFEKEFTQYGGEVKVTQASRDGGVDAIAFDPDPIRGGKIAIQAKRYTNTVGVSAVRDLYGTVINEGATKGILITTSDYGPDAYAFAKGKPIALLNGGNLLNLLEKHGYKARIDLRAAKQILSEKERQQGS